jgi:hypothetical protein
VRVGVLPDHRRVKARAGVLPGRHRVKVRAGVLRDHRRVKVRVGGLPGSSLFMAEAAALRANQPAVGALQDHRPVKAAEGAVVAAMVVADKAAGTTSSRAAVSLNQSVTSGNGTSLRDRQRTGDISNIVRLTSPAPTSSALKNHLADQASASVGA